MQSRRAQERRQHDGNDQHHERHAPARQRGDDAGSGGADDRPHVHGVAVRREHTWAIDGLVVVGQQRCVDRVVHQPAEAVAEPEHEQHADGAGEAGQQREDAGHDGAGDHELPAREPVAVVPDRNREEQHDGQVEDDDRAEGAIREIERVLDVRRQHVERGCVELVEEEQQEQDRERQDRHAAADRLEAPREAHALAALAALAHAVRLID